MTTAVLATYYPPRRRLTVSYAGHPTGWLFRADTGAWARLAALHGHAASDELTHDDVTFLLAEFVAGPAGPALWQVFTHRLLRQERR